VIFLFQAGEDLCRFNSVERGEELLLPAVAVILAWFSLIPFASSQQGSSSSNDDGGGRTTADLRPGTNEFGGWIGYSPSSPLVIGASPDRKLFLLNGSYARVLGNTKSVAIKYVLDVVPVALITQPAEAFVTSSGAVISHNARTLYGGGLDPIGFQFNFRRGYKWQPFADLHGGFLYFTEQVPAINSSQYNFTVSFGGGVQVFSGDRTSFSIGYNYYHLSNAYTGNDNPGVDGNLFFAAFSFFRRR
jgi:lipid A 3-O-deacylase PagL